MRTTAVCAACVRQRGVTFRRASLAFARRVSQSAHGRCFVSIQCLRSVSSVKRGLSVTFRSMALADAEAEFGEPVNSTSLAGFRPPVGKKVEVLLIDQW